MIHYLTGDATQPIAIQGNRFIVQIVNDELKWGRGFVNAVEKAYPGSRERYLRNTDAELGDFMHHMIGKEEDKLWLANLYGQQGIYRRGREDAPIRYHELNRSLDRLHMAVESTRKLTGEGCSLHMPRIGTGLAGGEWFRIKRLLETFPERTPIFVYDLPNPPEGKQLEIKMPNG